jgi:hypothetical protein
VPGSDFEAPVFQYGGPGKNVALKIGIGVSRQERELNTNFAADRP